METLEKLDYRIKAGLIDAKDEKEERINNRVKLPFYGTHGENIYITGMNRLLEKSAQLRNVYEKVPQSFRVASVVLLDAHASATIEGAYTTVERMKNCLLHPETKDEIMVANTYNGCMYGYSHEVTEENIRTLWEAIVEGVCENSDGIGILYRTNEVQIGNQFKTVYVPPKAEDVPGYMKKLWKLNASLDMDPLIKSFVFHFLFVYVHPFCDGNGRTARTLNSSQLYYSGFTKVKSIAIASAINANLQNYYKKIADCEKVIDARKKEKWLDLSPFIDYMLDVWEQAMINSILANNQLSEVEKAILDRMKLSGPKAEIGVKKAMAVTDSSETTTRNALNSLANKGYLRINKTVRPYIYQLLPSIPVEEN